MFALFDLTCFRVLLARDWSEQRDKELALGELADGDARATAAVRTHYRDRLTARLRRVEE